MKHVFSIMIGLFTVAQLSAQEKYTTNYEVQYKVTYSIDSTQLEEKQDETVYLYTGSEFGVFMNQDKAKADELQADMQKQIRSGGHITIKSGNSNFKKVFYKDLQTGSVLTEADIGSKTFKFEEPKLPLNWQVKNSVRKMKDYNVQKAITSFGGRNYVAWFTLSVPIHDGPYLFSGLPGLIIKLYDSERDYVFTLESFQKLEKPKTWTLPEAKKVRKSTFKELKAKAKKNAQTNLPSFLSQALSDQNMTVDESDISIKFTQDGRELSKGETRRLLRKIKESKNNPIELH